MKSLKDYSNEELLQEVSRRNLAGCTFFMPTLHPPNKVLTVKGGEGYVSNAFLITWTTSAGHIMRDCIKFFIILNTTLYSKYLSNFREFATDFYYSTLRGNCQGTVTNYLPDYSG